MAFLARTIRKQFARGRRKILQRFRRESDVSALRVVVLRSAESTALVGLTREDEVLEQRRIGLQARLAQHPDDRFRPHLERTVRVQVVLTDQQRKLVPVGRHCES